MDDYVSFNAEAWDHEASNGNIWTDGCSSEQVEKARRGELEMILSPCKKVPSAWISGAKSKKVLCLACGGGQQGILLSAYGADVTVFDISTKQIEQDARIAKRENLQLLTLQGDMRDLSQFSDESFDLIYNPTSTCFIDDVNHIYRQCNRILKPRGELLTSAINPALYLFDEKAVLKNKMRVKYTIPFSDLKSLGKKELQRRLKKHDTVEFSHTLDDLIGGLCRSGFALIDFYSDSSGFTLMDGYVHDCYLSIRAKKVE